ncbi:MAG TPA: RHS repeat-associated core domain-containing protein [Burkholderiaceae bacterium]|nr:RHS repeat-associated core domain-containing protein [Burkholderiaceae bacterium]
MRRTITVGIVGALTFSAGIGWADDLLLDAPAQLMESNVIEPAMDTPAGQATQAGQGALLTSDAEAQPLSATLDSGSSSDTQTIAMAAATFATTAAGRTPGSFGVTTSGAATYRIPIWTPPGVGDVKLDLALVYNSRSGNGVLGQGWSIAGLSAITRCNKSWAQDGAPGPVNNTMTDRICLDGQQLKRVSGNPLTDGAVYATEIESFSKVVASGSVGNGPASFTVMTKNGLVYEYGGTTDSRIYAGSTGTIRTWALSRIRDRASITDGNAITITYVNEAQNGSYGNGTFRVSSISYPTTTTGQGPFYRVSFTYSARPTNDPVVGYLAGSVVQELNKLDTITITDLVSGTTIKSYNLAYAQGTTSSRLQLSSVQECASTTGNCFAPTTISYQQSTKSWDSAATLAPFGANGKAAIKPIDLNGDGRTDVVYPDGVGNGVMHWYARLAQSSGFGPAIDTGVQAQYTVPIIVGHFLGNGRMQFMIPQASYWNVYDLNGSTFQHASTGLLQGGEFSAGDFDGDGLDDLVASVATSPVSVTVRRNTSVPAPGLVAATFATTVTTAWTAAAGQSLKGLGSWKVADFNGDGRADITAYTATTSGGWTSYAMYPLLSNGFGGAFTVGAALPGADASSWVVGDWNADGCSDLLRVTAVRISDCSGGFASISSGATGAVGAAVLPVDWDDDGRTDLVYVHDNGGWVQNTWYVVRSTGTGVASPVATGIQAPDNTAWFDLDQDGDGRQDLAWRDNDNGKVWFHLHKSAGAPADLATNFVDGFGMSQSPSYASIAISNYTKETGAAFPELDYQGPLYVVSQATSTDGTDGTYQNQFQYYGAWVNLQGRGFEGFHTQRTFDSRNGTYTFDFLQRAFPYTGMHTQRTVQPQPTGNVKYSEWVASVNQQTLGTGTEQRVFPYVASSTDSRWEVGGASDGLLVTQSTDSFSYNDGYGNRNVVTRSVTDKDPGSPYNGTTWQSTLTTTYANDTTRNCLGLPQSTAVQQSVPGQTSKTRSTSYSVDTDRCRIWQQVIEPSTAALKVTTTLAFNSADCGNASSVQIVGANPDGSAMAARTTLFGYGTRCQLPETLTNALSQVSQVTYRYDFGVPTSVTDPNTIVTSWGYDDFGRRTLETRPDQTTTSWAFESCSTGPCWGANDLRFHVYETSKGSDQSIYDQREQLYDGFDRLRSEQHRRALGAWVTESRQYDSLGRTTRMDRPASAGSNGYVTQSYDVLNRVIAQSLYQSNGTLDRTTGIGYAGRTVSTADPLGRLHKQVFDVAGRLRRVTDPSPGGTTKYDYDAFGNLNRIEDPIGAVSSGDYNLRGFRRWWGDADRGLWIFSGNSLNELVGWNDARYQGFSMTYDALGRRTSRTEPDGTSSWIWGNSAAEHNIGRLASKSGYGYAEALTYDAAGRLAARKITTEQQDYFFDYAYNPIGAVDTLTYPVSPVPTGGTATRFKVKYAYSYGEAVSVTDVTDSPVPLWTMTSANDYDSPTGETLGNGVTVSSGFKAWTNELTTHQAGASPSTTNRQNLAYQWDTAGNLTQRQDVNQALTEAFTMDGLDRVTSSTLNGTANFSAGYDASGNLTSRSDVGALTYGNASHPHAVMSAGSHSYTYDANGNQITRDGASQAWASFNLPVQLSQPIGGTTYVSQFSYGPDHQRWKQVASYSNGTETTWYVGGLLEKESPAPTGATQWRHYVYLPSGMAIIVARASDNQKTVRYLLTDHLGSTDKILDESGVVTVAESFAAYGNRRGSDWGGTPPDWPGIANTTRHGYTGHEHLDNLLLIHMNGRVYDPGTGRFLSVDPIIGDLGDSQQVNPYAYVGNRPLSFTDPSGLCLMAPGNVVCTAQDFASQNYVLGVLDVVADVLAFAGLFGGHSAPPPPATVMGGQSAQSGGIMCGPGQWGPVCGGWVLSMSGQGVEGGGRGSAPSSTWSIETSAADPYAQENLERFFIDLGVNAVHVIILAPYYDAKEAYEAGKAGHYATAVIYVAFTICDVTECKPLGRVVEPWARAAKNLRVTGRAARGAAQVTLNREAGNVFRDQLASQLSKAGREVSTEVYKKTPFGKRFIDIEVSRNGEVLGGIETKVGSSRYTPLQQLKDWWLTEIEGYPVNVARQP